MTKCKICKKNDSDPNLRIYPNKEGTYESGYCYPCAMDIAIETNRLTGKWVFLIIKEV